jgi:hypothetical protein
MKTQRIILSALFAIAIANLAVADPLPDYQSSSSFFPCFYFERKTFELM